MNHQNIAVFGGGWWERAIQADGGQPVVLPVPDTPEGNPYAADVQARLTAGRQVRQNQRVTDCELWLDNGGAGLQFVSGAGGDNDLHLLHESCRRILASHFVDPIHVCFQGMPWEILWLALSSQSWLKLVWDRAHASELERMSVPHVVHLPMAAVDRDYDDRPLTPDDAETAVSFVGGQNTRYFSSNMNVGTANLFAGALAAGVRDGTPELCFYDIYHDLYGLGAPPGPMDSVTDRVTKLHRYFALKLFYHASLCVRNRDRWVLFLKKHLGDAFRLIGRGWDTAYGLNCEPPIASDDDYLRHFRRTAININLVNGNAETALNMRHFEITAAGGFLLCFDQPELHDAFVVGEECDVFRSEAELLSKIEYYLANPRRRIEIARAGQRRTLSQHLYSHRLKALLGFLNRDSAASCGPARTHTAEPAPVRA